ncbi:MAG: D-alanyl-D-alanine carboxypeptidase [Proteobacteria bacterium]|nr:D-alanyl-D-alanine carboxypeptidase [Pseudomonadota bacterium]
MPRLPARVATLLSLLLLAAAASAATAVPPPPPLAAKGWVLLDTTSGRVLIGQNDTERLAPASLTKLMTSYVVFHALRDGKLKLDQDVPVSEHAWRVGGATSDGSTSYLPVHSQVKVVDAIQGMIVQSGNDATIVLAEAVAGSEQTFAVLMNQYAQQLGLKGTHWTNSAGLPDPQHYTTARDIAILGAALVREFPEYYKWFSQREFTYNHIRQFNRNGLLERDPSVDGIKTGHTEAAGFCLASSAQRDGMRLVSVVMGTASPKAREDASESLLGWGFSFFETKRLYTAQQRVGQAHVWKTGDPVPLVVHGDLYATAPRGDLAGAQAQLLLTPRLVAPLAAGAPVGRLRVTLGGATIAEAPVYPAAAVEPGNVLRRLIDSVRLWFN